MLFAAIVEVRKKKVVEEEEEEEQAFGTEERWRQFGGKEVNGERNETGNIANR